MKLNDITPTLVDLLRKHAALAGIPIIEGINQDHNQRLDTALREHGRALVLYVALGTAGDAGKGVLTVQSQAIIAVIENPVVAPNAPKCLELVEAVLAALHQPTFTDKRGFHPAFAFGQPAFEAGPLDEGLVVYFVNVTARTQA